MLDKPVQSLSYTDFIGVVNQWNVPPGAYNTLSRWITHSRIDESSEVLEIACSTGFSLRETAYMTNCSGLGIDISSKSVDAANYNLARCNLDLNIEFKCANAYSAKFDRKFSHMIIGGALKFFPKPESLLKTSTNWLNDEAYILASPFFVTSEIPDELLKRAHAVFGITPTIEGYKEVMTLYENFEIVHEEKYNIVSETKDEIKKYCNDTIEYSAERLGKISDEQRNEIFNRLFDVREMSNRLRPFQKYSCLVLRYRKNIYPRRLVELF